jgi:predicted phage tail protein
MPIPAFDENTRLTDPAVTDDVLASKQFLTLVELLGEGVIEGFATASKEGHTQGTQNYLNASLKDVFLNGTPVLIASANSLSPISTDFNFPNVSFEERFGTSDQTAIQGISDIETENSVGVAVTKASSVSRSITNTSVNAVRVTLGFPSLQKFEDDGDINGAEVAINIQTIENDGTTTTVITDTVKGRTASTYFRDYKINFASGTSFPVTIRVNRTTDDSTDVKLQNSSLWSSFTEIINEQRAYANSAHVAIRFDAETFKTIPKRMYKVRGTKIKIPHNGTVQTDGSISYSGTFNGTFKTDKEWTNDPAWILYDLLTTSKGFGDQIDTSQLDVFSFYSASVYCAEQVDDGSGNNTTEPRFACNVVIQNQKQAYNLINDLCSVMRVMPFYSAGTISITQDRPTDPSYLFNLSNVTEQGFTYSNSSKNSKVTVVNVGYFDNETQQIEYETVEDTALQAKYGIVTKNLRGFATTSRGQASRLGKWFLYTQSNEAEVVTFTTTLESGTIVRPGAVINIADPLRAGVRRGGRIKTGVSTTQIVVDDENNTDLATTGSATLSVILADGTLETKTIDTISGTTITVSSAFSSTPPSNSVWVIENTTVQLQVFRVVGVTEVGQLAYQITAVAHNSSKYTNIEDGTALSTRTITTLTEIKPSPSNLQGSEQIVVLNNRAVSKLFIQWQPVSGVTEYMVQYRFQNENFISQRITRSDFTIFETKNGTYEIRVFSYNALGKPSTNPSTITFTTVGKTALPEDPSGLTSEPVSDNFIRLRFNPSTSVDVTHGGTISVRHTSDTSTSATFQNSTEIIPQLSGNITETIVPALTGTYSIKFIDDTGNRSANAAKIVVTKPEPQPNQIITTKREDQTSPPFNGTRVRTVFSDEFNGLVLDGTQFFDNVTDVNALANFDFLGDGIVSQGFYSFVDDLDLEAVFNLSLIRHFKTAAIVVSDLWDSRVSLVDDMPDWDGTLAEDVGAKLQVATCQGVPTASLASTYSQSQDLITITRTSHGAVVNDQVLVDFTSGAATDGFLKIASITNDNVFVAEANRQLAEYEVVNASTGEIQFFTTGDHGGLVVNDTVNLRVLTGNLTSGDYTVGSLLSLGIVKITTSSNNLITSGTVEFIKVKDNSGNNVTTSGNCNISSAFSPFNIFANGEYNARGFRFRADIFSNDPDENIEIDELGYTASMKRRTETVNTAIASDCATNNSAKTVSFGNSFFTGTSAINSSTSAFLPTIGITLEGAVSGDYFKITSVTGTQFVIETRDSSNNLKDLSFKYTAIGFGKGA